MSEESMHVCIDRVLPAELAAVARTLHAQEHGLTEASPFEMALVSQKMWKPGRTLKVCFLDGEPDVRKKIADMAKQWMNYANVNLQFVDGTSGDIRISLKETGYWSAVGTDALVEQFFAKTAPTMNFQGFTMATPDEEYSRVVLHEFGHALGCIHEHSSPVAGIQWNKEVVYRELGGPPNNWSKATVDHNVFEVYSKTVTQFTEFDPKSIMLYSFPKRWTLNNMEFTTNRVLSDTDKKFIASRYPKAQPTS